MIELKNDRTFRDLYEKLANEYCRENHTLYTTIAQLLGLKPFYGTGNKEQVIWAKTQKEANDLPAGANIYKYIKFAITDFKDGKAS